MSRFALISPANIQDAYSWFYSFSRSCWKSDFEGNGWCFVDLGHCEGDFQLFSISTHCECILKKKRFFLRNIDYYWFAWANGIFYFWSLLEELVPKHHKCHWYCKILTKSNPNFHHNLCHCQSKFSAQLILRPEIKVSHFCHNLTFQQDHN